MRLVHYIRDGLSDVVAGLRHHDIWLLLGWAEIRQRYRRSTLGPFWLTISMAATIGGMGPLYGRLFNQDISSYMSYLAIGLVLWTLISTVITETSGGFIASEGYIKEFDLPLSIYIIRVVWRNYIVLAHNIIVVLIVLVFYMPDLGWSLLLLPVALLAIALNGIFLGLLLGILCTRFRDVQQIISSVLQIVFFLTPILWRPEMLGNKAWLLNFNPVFFFIESVRAPLLGHSVMPEIWVGVVMSTIMIMTLALLVHGKYRYRIAYWL